MGLGFPRQLKVNLEYVETIKLQAASGVFTTYFFSANGMFDPNLTGTGHQPMYFDQYMALYNHFTVIGSKIVVRFLRTNDTDPACRVGLLQSDDASYGGSPNLDAIKEATLGKTKIIGLDTPTVTMAMGWSAKKTFGGSTLGDDQLIGTATANPAEQSTFMLCLEGMPSNSTSCAVYAEVEIRYCAILDELKDTVES